MSTPTFERDQTVYGPNGEVARYIAPHPEGGHIVVPVFEREDRELGFYEEYGNPRVWSKIHDTESDHKIDSQIAARQETLRQLNNEISAKQTEQREMDADQKARMDRIKMHEGLEMLDRYLNGEITHYVATHEYYPTVQIIPIGETIEGYSSGRGYGLLTLMPSRTWDKRIVFSVTYQSGRNSYDSRTTNVIPCFGEEDAKTKAAEWITQKVADYLALEPKRRSYIERLFSACAAYGVAVPQQLIDDQNELDRENLLAQRDKAKKELTEIEAKLTLTTAKAEGGAV